MNLSRLPADLEELVEEEELDHLFPRAAEQPDHSINGTLQKPA